MHDLIHDDATTALLTATDSESTSQEAAPYATPNPLRKVPVNNTAAFLARESGAAFNSFAYQTDQESVKIDPTSGDNFGFNDTIMVNEPPANTFSAKSWA